MEKSHMEYKNLNACILGRPGKGKRNPTLDNKELVKNYNTKGSLKKQIDRTYKGLEYFTPAFFYILDRKEMRK